MQSKTVRPKYYALIDGRAIFRYGSDNITLDEIYDKEYGSFYDFRKLVMLHSIEKLYVQDRYKLVSTSGDKLATDGNLTIKTNAGNIKVKDLFFKKKKKERYRDIFNKRISYEKDYDVEPYIRGYEVVPPGIMYKLEVEVNTLHVNGYTVVL
jgi:hypothetical protein